MIIEEETYESPLPPLNQLKPAAGDENDSHLLNEKDIDFTPKTPNYLRNPPISQNDIVIFQKILFKTIKMYSDSVIGKSIVPADYLDKPIGLVDK